MTRASPLASRAPAAVVLIRSAVGAVFLSEGIREFLFPAARGVGRFAEIGLPAPEILAPFVGVTETASGALVLAGLLTRFAAVPLAVIMIVALATTKVPVRLSRGVWAMAHDARTDWAMLLGAVLLLTVGAGPWSVDARLAKRAAS